MAKNYAQRMRAKDVGLLVVVGLVAAVSCSSASTHREPAPSGSDESVATDASPESPSSTLDVAVLTSSGSDVEGLVVEPVAGDVPVPVGFNPAGPPVDIHVPDGVVVGPVMVSVPGLAPPSDAIPLLMHRNDAGGWESIPAVFAAGRYEAEVLSFSWYWPGWADTSADWVGSTAGKAVDAVGKVVGDGLNWIVGRTSQPEPCGSDPYPWVTSSGSPPDGAFHVCLEQNPTEDGSERVDVKIKSNRAFAMWVVVPRAGADFVWVEGSSWDLVGPVLNAFTAGPSERVLLGPGRTLTVGYQRPSLVASELTFFAYQDTVTQMFTLLTRHYGELDGALATVLAAISCFDKSLGGLANLSWEGAVECLSAVVGATESQLEQAFDRAVSSGRFALADGDRDAFRSAVFRTSRLRDAMAVMKKGAAVLTWTALAADGLTLAHDAGLGLVKGAGTLLVTLLSSPTPRPELPRDVRAVDFGNALLPGNSCRGNPYPIQLVGGEGSAGQDGEYREVWSVTVEGFADLDGNGVEDAVLDVGCSGGGLAVWTEIAPISVNADGSLYLVGGVSLGSNEYKVKTSGVLSVAGGSIVAAEVYDRGGEPECCFTGQATTTYTWTGSGFSSDTVREAEE